MIEVVGVDSHIATVAASGVDAAGRELASREFANDPAGHEAFAAWIAECAPQGCRIGVEGALGFAFALVEHLLAAGLEVVEVPAHLTRRETRHLRGQGRSDPRDALAIARVTLREQELAAASPRPPVARLKLVHDYRRQLTVERTRTANRLHADLFALEPGYRTQARSPRVRHLAAAARMLRGDERMQARSRGDGWRGYAGSTARSTRSSASRPCSSPRPTPDSSGSAGSRPLLAARILGEVGDIRRFATRDAFAAGNGTAPIPASCGARHALPAQPRRQPPPQLRDPHHGADPDADRPPSPRHIARRRAEGKSTAEAMRSLKRHLSDVIYNQLQADLRAAAEGPQLT